MTAPRCPACNGPSEPGPANRWRPFCSERCKMGDLGQWFAGRYTIPADDATPGEAPPAPKDPQRQ